MTSREWMVFLLGWTAGVVTATVVPLLPNPFLAHAQDDRSEALQEGDWYQGCTGAVEEHEMPHAYCYTVDGEGMGCVARYGRLMLEKGVQE